MLLVRNPALDNKALSQSVSPPVLILSPHPQCGWYHGGWGGGARSRKPTSEELLALVSLRE